MPTLAHKFFETDLPFGLCTFKDIANMLKVCCCSPDTHITTLLLPTCSLLLPTYSLLLTTYCLIRTTH